MKWRCEAAGANTLDVRSADGLAGVATDCRMDFSIEADGDASIVDLAMSYEPASPLALLAAPVLVVDNWLALNVLLPRAFSGVSRSTTGRARTGVFRAAVDVALRRRAGDTV